MSKKDNRAAAFRAGGAATAGGMNFQAAVTTIAAIYMVRGRPLLWLDGLVDDVPVRIAAETGGGGDDLRLEYRSGVSSEVQIKRGLQASPRLWESLEKLALAVHRAEIGFGVLVICPESSRTITRDLAEDIIRLGEGRSDNLSPIAAEFDQKLGKLGLSASAVCRRLRIVTMHALSGDQASILAARAELDHVCRDKSQIGQAWDRLYRDAGEIIQLRAARTAASITHLLVSAGIEIVTATSDAPAAVLTRLTAWVIKTNASFSILGVQKQLSIEDAWISLPIAVSKPDTNAPAELAEALERYHKWDDRQHPRDVSFIEPDTLGLFYRHAVLVAGPGMGKTTLLTRLARRYAQAGKPVLKVNLRNVAVRIRAHGESFEEATFALGLAGSGVGATELQALKFADLVLLCDALDECGADQEAVAEGLMGFIAGHPRCTAILTTRPVGYHTGRLTDWRHYEVSALSKDSAPKHLGDLVREILASDDSRRKGVAGLTAKYLEDSPIGNLVVRSPLLLGIAASLFARGDALGETKAQLYAGVFKLLDEPSPRATSFTPEATILRSALNVYGALIVESPTMPTEKMVRECGMILAPELGYPALKARELAESCLRHWQDVGVVERVQHGGAETITFVHKTFAEYAAARRLTELDAEDRKQALMTNAGRTGWFEVLGFGVTMGMAEPILSALLAGMKSQSATSEREHVELLSAASPPPSKAVTTALFERAFAELHDEDRRATYRLGMSLAKAAKRFPDEVGSRAAKLLEDPHPPARLAAWAAALATGTEYYAFERLQEVAVELPHTVRGGLWPSLGGGSVLESVGPDLAQFFAMHAAHQILKRCPAEKAKSILAEMLKADALRSMGFQGDLARILPDEQTRAELIAGYAHWGDSLRSILPNDEFWLDMRRGYANVFATLARDGDCITSAETAAARERPFPLPYLGAFATLTRMGDMPPYDVRRWQGLEWDDVAEEVYRGIAKCINVPADKLAREAALFCSAVEQTPENDYLSVFDFLPSVDIPDPDERVAKEIGLDSTKLERACHHRSIYLAQNAAWLLYSVLEPSARAPCLERLLAAGRRHTLQIAAWLADELPSPVALELVRARLKQPIVPGCEYLFAVLEKKGASLDVDTMAGLGTGLLSEDVDTAVAAANFAMTLAKPDAIELYQLLGAAFTHWQTHEEPYPEKGGVVPTSPRAKLLSATHRIRPPTYEELAPAVRDPRPDVREIVESAVVNCLQESEDARNAFVDDALGGRLPSSLISKALKARIAFDAPNVERMIPLLHDSNPRVRFAAMNLLKPPYLAEDRIEMLAKTMLEDEESEIQDRARRLMSQLSPV
jgi:hypothetical protein